MALVPDSLPDSQSQRGDYCLEATQVSQPMYSQTQASQNVSSQVEPRRKYWAILIPTNPQHSILKLPWSMPSMQVGRGPNPELGNDLVLREKRVSNKHCRITLGPPSGELDGNGYGAGPSGGGYWNPKDLDGEPQVWIEDLKSSNGTYVNGVRLSPRRLLQHGDEISLGHVGTADGHDVRYIYRSVGIKGTRYTSSNGNDDRVGEVYERYQLLGRLGKGTFAEVHKAVEYETGNLRAIKQIVKHRFGHNPKTLVLFQREIDICTNLTHENICRLIEWYEDPQHICLVLEYIDGGDLLDHIMQYPTPALPEDYAADLTWQICSAMAYCHEQGVTHRDLKPEETEEQPAVIKIADFGLAKMVHEQTRLTSMVGTPQYLAPEVVMQTSAKPGYENVVDCWSVGIIVYSMLTKALPFDEDQELPIEKRVRARFDQDFDVATLRQLNVTGDAIDFIARLLAKDPAQRMSMAQALQHPWLAQPSSQPGSDSQPSILGGDSMWNVRSFDNFAGPVEEGDDDHTSNAGSTTRRERHWTRPMTESANMPSALPSRSHSHFAPPTGDDSDGKPVLTGSSESFSQPMQNLHLYTPVPASGLGNEVEMDRVLPLKNETDAAAQRPANGSSTNTNASRSTGKSYSATDAQVSSVTPGKTKRKVERSDWFSSGSLSPPPEDSAEASAISVDLGQNGAGRAAEGAAAAGTANGQAGGEAKPNGKAKKGKEKKAFEPTRSSPRRPRKSVRLG
ncbi:hypothetical protein Q5752_005251 [Cryptotrichosporon argae]